MLQKPPVEYHPFARTSPCWPLLVEGFNEITQDGFAVPAMNIKARDEALYIRSLDGDIVAALAFGMKKYPLQILVRLVYVEPSSRRQGLFKALWQDLTSRARNADCDSICAEVHPKDATALGIFYGKANSEAQTIRFACSVR